MARTKADFTKTPWTTNQSYVRDSLFQELKIESLRQIEDLFIYNVNTRQEVSLKLVPDQMSESYSPKIVTVTPFGVITPINFYVGGGEKKISFSFKMHEDLQGIGGSIYNTVEILENMAKPIYINGRLLEPIVYFQLGEQFIGKGHISTNFAYNKPFRNNRYIAVDVSMTFTFHEQFEDDLVTFNDTYSSDLSPFAIDSNLIENNSYVDDFILFQADPDYFVTQIFGSQKFKTYFNTVVTSQNEYILETLNTGWNRDDRVQFIEGLESSAITPLSEGQEVQASNYFSNPYALEVIDLFFNLQEVMYSLKTSSIVSFIASYNRLRDEVNALRNDFETSYNPTLLLSENDTSIGWYEKSAFIEGDPNPLQSIWVQMSSSEQTAFKELLDYFENIVIGQINLYESLRGAGS